MIFRNKTYLILAFIVMRGRIYFDQRQDMPFPGGDDHRPGSDSGAEPEFKRLENVFLISVYRNLGHYPVTSQTRFP